MRNSLSKFEAELDYIAVRARSGVPGVQCETFLAIERLLERGCPTFVIARSVGVEAPVGLEGNMEVQKNLTLARVEKVLAGIFTESDVAEEKSSGQLKVDSDGVLRLGCKSYLTVGQFAKIFGVWNELVMNKIKAHEIPAVRAIASNGKECNFYDEQLMRILFEFRLNLPMADDEGLILLNNIPHHNLWYFKMKFGLDFGTVEKAVKDAGVESIPGRDRNGKICDYYSDKSVDKLLMPYKRLKRADSDGVIILNGRKYTTIDNLPGFLSAITGKRSSKPYESAIERAGLDFEEGLGIQGKICEFYCIEDVQGLL